MSWQTVLSTLEGFGWNYLSTLLMAGVVSYLGLFTVLRRIVFTGVALAQVAAAGVGAAFFVADHSSVSPAVARFAGSYGATLGSFILTLLAALGVRTRASRGRVGGDAIVGFLYVLSAALAVLLVWRSSRGLAELREILAGEVLLTSAGELILLGIALTIVAAIHVHWRDKFLLVAYDPEFARTLGLRVGRIDGLFLATFATAVAFSLRAGGLLLVFAYLVLPGMIGLTLGRRLHEATVLSIAVALGGSFAGYAFAIVSDLPVSHSIAAVLGLTFVAIQPTRGAGFFAHIARGLILAAGLGGVGIGVWLLPGLVASIGGTPSISSTGHGHHHAGSATPPSTAERVAQAIGHLRGDGTVEERTLAAATLGELGGPDSLPTLLPALADENPTVHDAVVHSVRAFTERRGTSRMRVLARGPEAELAAHASRALVIVGDELALGFLVAFLEREDAPLLLRDELLTELRDATGQSFGYDAFAAPKENTDAIAQWWAWWEANRPE